MNLKFKELSRAFYFCSWKTGQSGAISTSLCKYFSELIQLIFLHSFYFSIRLLTFFRVEKLLSADDTVTAVNTTKILIRKL